jgi:hypothetical protein
LKIGDGDKTGKILVSLRKMIDEVFDGFDSQFFKPGLQDRANSRDIFNRRREIHGFCERF